MGSTLLTVLSGVTTIGAYLVPSIEFAMKMMAIFKAQPGASFTFQVQTIQADALTDAQATIDAWGKEAKK